MNIKNAIPPARPPPQRLLAEFSSASILSSAPSHLQRLPLPPSPITVIVPLPVIFTQRGYPHGGLNE